MLRTPIIASLLMVFSLAALAAPKAELWERWTAHQPDSTEQIDHRNWDRFLKTYVVKDGDLNRVRYGAVNGKDRQSLDAYIRQLQDTAISQFNRAEQLAYWINLYNALTVQLILDNYPVSSITKIKSGLFAFGPWDRKLLTIENEEVSLNDIEHRILRPIWNNPLIHYAVNCASVGCPNLAMEAYTASNSWELAKSNAGDYINSPRGARLEGDKLRVSSIYIWFSADFGVDESATIAHLADYAEPSLANALRNVSRIHGHDYDWSLNEAP